MFDILILIEELIQLGLSIAMTKRKASRVKMTQQRISLEVGGEFCCSCSDFDDCRSHHHVSVESRPE